MIIYCSTVFTLYCYSPSRGVMTSQSRDQPSVIQFIGSWSIYGRPERKKLRWPNFQSCLSVSRIFSCLLMMAHALPVSKGDVRGRNAQRDVVQMHQSVDMWTWWPWCVPFDWLALEQHMRGIVFNFSLSLFLKNKKNINFYYRYWLLPCTTGWLFLLPWPWRRRRRFRIYIHSGLFLSRLLVSFWLPGCLICQGHLPLFFFVVVVWGCHRLFASRLWRHLFGKKSTKVTILCLVITIFIISYSCVCLIRIVTWRSRPHGRIRERNCSSRFRRNLRRRQRWQLNHRPPWPHRPFTVLSLLQLPVCCSISSARRRLH